MTKQEALEILKLLSALESWSFANAKDGLPDYLQAQVASAMEVLQRVILK